MRGVTRPRLLETRNGQSLVELALTLPIIVLLMMGIIDLGFVLYAHVQVAAAAGEGANVGSRFTVEKDPSNTQADYDEQRLEAVSGAVTRSMGRLTLSGASFTPLPNFNVPQTGNPDILVTYSGAGSNATRVASTLTDTPVEIIVRVKYRQRLLFGFIPFATTISGNKYFEVNTTTRARIH